jgi:hypothetical protein
MFLLIKRDLKMRLYYGRKLILTQLLFFVIVTLFYIFVFEVNELTRQAMWVSPARFWNGFSIMDLELFRESGDFHLPFGWLFFQLLFFLSLRTFFVTDLTSSSGFILLRTGLRKFIISKISSLFLYTAIYVCLFMAFIISVSLLQFLLFQVPLSFVLEWRITAVFFVFLIVTLFIEALFFEMITVLIGEILSFLIVFIFNFISMFSTNVLLIGNYSMYSRWEESMVLASHIPFLLVWIVIVFLCCCMAEWLVISRMDILDEKGEK